jgi:hypothetical protein
METYVTPIVEEIETFPEGVICASNELVYENEGEW